MSRPEFGTAPIRCGTTRCKWRGFETDLKNVPTRQFEGIKATKRVCPTCGGDSYMFMTLGEVKAWERKKALMKPSPEKQAADWNNAVNVGQEVDYRSDPGAEPVRFKTRCLAEVLSGHTAVVWLEGKSGCVSLEACTPVPVVEGGAA